MNRDRNPRLLTTTEHSLEIIEILRELDGARIIDLDGELDISKGTVYQHVATLREHGFVTKRGQEYHLSLKFANFGEYVRTRDPAYETGCELAEKLSEETGLRGVFLVEENGLGKYLKNTGEEIKGSQNKPLIGEEKRLHTTAAGKAILSVLPETRVDEIIDTRGLPQVTEKTITDERELKEELEKIERQGHAYNHGEHNDAVRAVGVPVRKSNGALLGAASTCGPDHLISEEWLRNQLPRQVKRIVREFDF